MSSVRLNQCDSIFSHIWTHMCPIRARVSNWNIKTIHHHIIFMNCKMCHSSIIDVIELNHIMSQYICLYRKLFPKKPIELVYCVGCYRQLLDCMENEKNSRSEHLKISQTPVGATISVSETTPAKYVVLNENSEEFIRIQSHFKQTMTNQIIRIEKINNPMLEHEFNKRSSHLTCQNIKHLFHGSSNTAYDSILETGFDLKYAAPTGLLGAGIYFAEDASYAHIYGHITKTTRGRINHVLYCKVNLGKTTRGYTGLTATPDGFDGVHSNCQTYAVFDNYQGIPEYIIYYVCDQ